MKYIKLTLQYLKSNIIILPSFIMVFISGVLILDHGAVERLISSIHDGFCTASIWDWLNVLIILNTSNTVTILLGLLGYVILIISVSFMHAILDKHMRFGTRSMRGIVSGMNSNAVSTTLAFFIALLFMTIFTFVEATVIWAFSLISVTYSFVVGLVFATIMLVAMIYLGTLFLLWLPCVEITGFRYFEALLYSYQLVTQIKGKLFVATLLPALIFISLSMVLALFLKPILFIIITSLLFACLVIYLAVLCYVAYMDAAHLEREDIKKGVIL